MKSSRTYPIHTHITCVCMQFELMYVPFDRNFHHVQRHFDGWHWLEAELMMSMHLYWAELMSVNSPSNRCRWLCAGTSLSRLQTNKRTKHIYKIEIQNLCMCATVARVSIHFIISHCFFSLCFCCVLCMDGFESNFCIGVKSFSIRRKWKQKP